MQTRNSFNGTWQTDVRMHKMFSKDLKLHESFTAIRVEKISSSMKALRKKRSIRGCCRIDCERMAAHGFIAEATVPGRTDIIRRIVIA